MGHPCLVPSCLLQQSSTICLHQNFANPIHFCGFGVFPPTVTLVHSLECTTWNMTILFPLVGADTPAGTAAPASWICPWISTGFLKRDRASRRPRSGLFGSQRGCEVVTSSGDRRQGGGWKVQHRRQGRAFGLPDVQRHARITKWITSASVQKAHAPLSESFLKTSV